MIRRKLNLNQILNQGFSSSFVFGARGTGKTHLCLDFLSTEPHLTINLLLGNLYRRYLKRPEQLRADVLAALKKNPKLTVFIDEVQRVPELLNEVHALIEEHQSDLRFLLTGSSARKLRREGANMLAGRAFTLKLHPLTHMEVEIDLGRALQFGTLPKFYLATTQPKKALEAYISTYLKEEIQQEALVRKVDSFARFLDVAAQMHSEVVNYSKIASEADISDKTVEEYFSILVDTLIAFRIYGWSRSVRKQLLQSPKYYFFDCGVLNALRGELSVELRPSTFRFGKLFETFIILEVIRLNDYYDCDFKFNYWRTNTGLEVDLVLSRSSYDKLIGIEIKSSEAPQEIDFGALNAFADDNPGAILICLCQTPHAYRVGTVDVFPWQEGIQMLLKIETQSQGAN